MPDSLTGDRVASLSFSLSVVLSLFPPIPQLPLPSSSAASSSFSTSSPRRIPTSARRDEREREREVEEEGEGDGWEARGPKGDSRGSQTSTFVHFRLEKFFFTRDFQFFGFDKRLNFTLSYTIPFLIPRNSFVIILE